jgi:ribosomal protein L7/L12
MATFIIVFAIAITVLLFVFFMVTQQETKQKNDWATGAKPASLDWNVLLSSEIQACLPDKKIEAIKHYREQTGVGLKEAKDAVEYAMAYPDRAPSHLSSSDFSESRKTKSDEAGLDWDLLLSDQMQALLPDKKIDAIKLYREQTGAGLKEAKDAIEEYLINPEAVPAKIRRYDLVEQQSDGIRDLLREGKRDEARKTYQAFTGVDQFTANEAIDALEEEIRTEADRYDRMQGIFPSDDTYDEGQKRRPS